MTFLIFWPNLKAEGTLQKKNIMKYHKKKLGGGMQKNLVQHVFDTFSKALFRLILGILYPILGTRSVKQIKLTSH